MTDHAPQEHRFQAETASLLDMMIHHLYTRREVFLRELISNASDAIDRQRLLALTSAGAGAEADDYRIRLIPDAAAGTKWSGWLASSRSRSASTSWLSPTVYTLSLIHICLQYLFQSPIRFEMQLLD